MQLVEAHRVQIDVANVRYSLILLVLLPINYTNLHKGHYEKIAFSAATLMLFGVACSSSNLTEDTALDVSDATIVVENTAPGAAVLRTTVVDDSDSDDLSFFEAALAEGVLEDLDLVFPLARPDVELMAYDQVDNLGEIRLIVLSLDEGKSTPEHKLGSLSAEETGLVFQSMNKCIDLASLTVQVWLSIDYLRLISSVS